MDLDRYASDATPKKTVLKIIAREKAITRSDLMDMTGLSITSITKYVGSLMTEGIIVECGTLESTGGRKSTLLGINPEYAYVLGIDLGGYAAKFGVIRMDGSIKESFLIPTQAREAPAAGLDEEGLCAQIESILSRYDSGRFMAICVSVSGMVDHSRGRIIFCPNVAGWDGAALGDILSQRFHLPVFVDTSARAMALAEQRFGAGEDVPHQLFLSIGSYSVADALIINGQLFRGSRGFAGGMGHVSVPDAGDTLCTCGNRGCLENVATMKSMVWNLYDTLRAFNGLSIVKQYLPEEFLDDALTPDLINRAIAAGDKQCYQAVHRAGYNVGLVLANFLNIVNLDLVVLGGGFIDFFPTIMLDAVKQAIREHALATVQNGLTIKPARLSWQGAVVGSALLAIDRFFA